MNAPPKVVPAAAGSPLTVLGEHVLLKFTSPDTNGLFTLTEQFNAPGTGIPLHLHTREDESFWVLEGQVEFVVADTTTMVEPGALSTPPRRGPQLPSGEYHAEPHAGAHRPGRFGNHVRGTQSTASRAA